MELNKSVLQKNGSKIIHITFFQALVTFIVVFAVVYLIAQEYKLTYALILASISTVTTPAPIVACMRSYHTNGKISEYICPIVAIDDMIGIILFSLALPFSIYFAGHTGQDIMTSSIVLGPILSIAFAIIVGGLFGYVMTRLLKYYKNSDNISIVLIIFIAVVIGISVSEVYGSSVILLPLVMGMVLSNGIPSQLLERFRSNTDAIVLPLLLVFFTISGADIHIQSFGLIGGLVAAYVLVRALAKILGTRLAANVIKEHPTIRKYLGFTMVPQGGIALDMAIIAELAFLQAVTETGEEYYAQLGTNIFTVILSAIIIYKIFGEIIVKWAFNKAGEIKNGVEEHNQPHVI